MKRLKGSNLRDFIGREVFCIYVDSGKELTAIGKLISIDNQTLAIQTRYNTLFLDASIVLKVKISRPMEGVV